MNDIAEYDSKNQMTILLSEMSKLIHIYLVHRDQSMPHVDE